MLYNRRDFGKLALGLAASGAFGCTHTKARLVIRPDEEAFLAGQARRVVESARLRAGERVGRYHNTTPYDLHVPGGNMGYPAFWIRDAVMMLGGDLISADELEGWIRLICSTIRGPSDWQVRPGVVVPAYCVPDHINFDGTACFYPGSYESGERQGGHPWGKYPPLDDNFYFLTAVYEHWRLTRSSRLFCSPIRTSFSEDRLADTCEKVYSMPPSDPRTGLVIAGDVDRENAKDWGFCDSIFKSGKLLFPSLLKLIAARQMAEMFAAGWDFARTAHYRAEARRIAAAVQSVFLNVSEADEAWLHSATGVGNQTDVWGSALAVHCGVLDHRAAQQVSRALVRGFRERTIVQRGFVRHIPTNDPVNRGAWEKSVSEPGKYQNGGYWGTPVGWYVSAMSKSDHRAAAELTAEYIQFLRQHLRPDGTTQAWEWVNEGSGDYVNPLYAATVALPYLCPKFSRQVQLS